MEILEFKKNYHHESPIFLKDVDMGKVLVSNKIYFREKKTINTLLATFIMIIKLSHYT